MTYAEFEEKQYENAANLEIAARPGDVFPSGGVLEATVAYDAVFLAGSPIIWQRLGLRGPVGAFLRPLYPTAADRLPSRRVSLILQYKRPEYMSDKRSKQWDLWNRAYYRFAISAVQHTNLKTLEASTKPLGVVRYAAPAFWEFRILEAKQLNQEVTDSSTFVAPSRIGAGHSWLTYDRPTRRGKPNQPADDIVMEDWAALGEVVRQAAQETSLEDHIRELKTRLEVGDQAVQRYDDILDEHRPFLDFYSPDQRRTYARYLAISEALLVRGYSWYVIAFDG